ncbi:hypothetical protein GCM10008903_08470 [Clostridium cadaveris]
MATNSTNMIIAVKKSRATIIFRLFTLSAKIPPKNDRTIIGRKEHAVTIPKIAPEPVSLNR